MEKKAPTPLRAATTEVGAIMLALQAISSFLREAPIAHLEIENVPKGLC